MTRTDSLDTVKQRFGIVGHNPKLIRAIEVARQVAPTDVTVLVYGENGTGKDVFSRIIHKYSKRKHSPFIAINCGAIPEGTMDSELFGHEKGAFTSAYESRKGYFEEVEGGTIFLDEIAEMPLATQSRLLRLLENGEYLRVGSSKIRRANVRVVAATNKNLIDLIRQGKFREDLYFRLNTVSIPVPPLRDRGDDIILLFNYFAMEFAAKYNRSPVQLAPGAEEPLFRYRWPGNVRELRNFAEKLTVLTEHIQLTEGEIIQYLDLRENYLPSVIRKDHFAPEGEDEEGKKPEVDLLYKLIFDLREEVTDLKKMLFMQMQQNAQGREQMKYYLESHEGDEAVMDILRHEPEQPGRQQQPLLEESLSLEEKEKELIRKALDKYNNNRKKAAEELGISERTLYRKIKNYDL